ncbi:hypothetical protein EDB85DRAFT_1891670 [Lactarius pseudohatsudake]|nr:hypothetical protein EDB85DRAFT_1891670 [Lactarius pseudohatsudake]
MARKGIKQLTKDKTSVLIIAAKFMGAIECMVSFPPTPLELTALTQMVHAELRTVAVTFNKCPLGTKMPRVHPVVQAIAGEWGAAKKHQENPSRDKMTLSEKHQLLVIVKGPGNPPGYCQVGLRVASLNPRPTHTPTTGFDGSCSATGLVTVYLPVSLVSSAHPHFLPHAAMRIMPRSCMTPFSKCLAAPPVSFPVPVSDYLLY